jgi:hypothetical protein
MHSAEDYSCRCSDTMDVFFKRNMIQQPFASSATSTMA